VKSIRVIGIGNPFRGDDGVGISVVRHLQNRSLSGKITLLEQGGEATALLEQLDGAEAVILVDAVQSGAAPGTVHRFDAAEQPLPSGVLRCSTHNFSVHEALEMARALDRLPQRVTVYGIEGDSFDPGEGLSPEVQRGVVTAAEQIILELNRWRDPSHA